LSLHRLKRGNWSPCRVLLLCSSGSDFDGRVLGCRAQGLSPIKDMRSKSRASSAIANSGKVWITP
jgi:hypothetical protein